MKLYDTNVQTKYKDTYLKFVVLAAKQKDEEYTKKLHNYLLTLVKTQIRGDNKGLGVTVKEIFINMYSDVFVFFEQV